MINRREFLRRSAGLAIGGSLLTTAGCAMTGQAGRRQIDDVGLQLYTVRNQMRDDFEGTLRKVAEIGYEEVEFAGLYNRKAADVRKLLDDLDLESPSSHIGYDLVRDKLPEVMEEAKALGQTYIIVPALPNEIRKDIDAYKRVAEVLNKAGEQVKSAGMLIAYHNHAFEFEKIGGQLPYDVLLQETDPDLVKMEADLFWMTKGGVRPLDYFSRFPGRFALVHVKDMTAAGEMAPVGEGQVNFAEIFAQEKKAGIRHYVVEHDNPTDAMASITTSIGTLSKLRY